MRSHSRTASKSRSRTERGTERNTLAETPFEVELDLEGDDQFQQAYARLLKDLQRKRLKRDNSFSYEFPDVEQLRDFGTNREESWKRFSVTLDAGKSLYTYRVDTVDQAVKRLLSHRDSKARDDIEPAESRPEGVERRVPTRTREATLEDPAAITVREPTHTQIDALFYRITVNVDEGGYQGLLMVTLEADADQSYVLGPRTGRSATGSLVSVGALVNEVADLADELARNQICPQVSAFRQQFSELSTRVNDFNLRVESTRISLPDDEFLAEDLQEVEHTLTERIRTTHVEIIAEAEPPYEFNEEKTEGGSAVKVLEEAVELDSMGSLQVSTGLSHSTDFNVWDVTDPRAMRNRPARRPVRLSVRKTPQEHRPDRLARLRETLHPATKPPAEGSLRPLRQRSQLALDVACFEQLHVKKISFFNADFGFYFLRGGRIACPEPVAESTDKNEEEKYYDEDEMGGDGDEGGQSKSVPKPGGAGRKLRVDDLKARIYEICSTGDEETRLSYLCRKLAAVEPESAGLKHQSLFLVLLHTASEKGLTLLNYEGDILIKFPKA